MTEERSMTADGEPAKRHLPVVCRKLRTKNAFGSMQSGAPDWRLGESTTAVYWCLKTMETWGPDGALTHPHACKDGRTCFAAPDGEPVA